MPDTNDEWAELARELERDKPPAPPPLPDMVERQVEAEVFEPHYGLDARVEDETVAEGDPAEEEFDDAEESASSETEAAADGPGTGRKRRRRRRRRRKGGAAAPEVATIAEDDSESESNTEAIMTDESTESDDFGETEIVPLAAEEDTASEVLRDLIASWNVPSWDDIVSGLYRPN